MSTRYLGPSFDIHTGGVDNMFPHHDDEIAQSEAANGTAFVKYWLHCEHLTVNNTKMSKSLGNFFTLRDLLDRGFSGRTVRWLLMGTHYRQKLNFAYTPAATKTDDASFDGLEKARQALKRIDEFVARLNDDDARAADAPADDGQQFAEQALTDFRAALEDDLNIAGALAALFELVRAANRAMDHDRLSQTGKTCILDALREMDAVLGVIDVDEHTGGVPAEIVALAEERREARAAKDYQRSDELRDRLSEMGWSIKDGPDGYRLSRR
jgi:cysteinyl-tRNA synthetase